MTNKRSRSVVRNTFSGMVMPVAAALLAGNISSAEAQTFATTSGTLNWNSTANWTPATIPNSVGAAVIFNSPAGNISASLVGFSPTVGSITYNNSTATTIGIFNGTGGGPLIFDGTGAGPATITTTGTGTGNNTISATMTLNDDLLTTINNTSASSAAGSLNLTGTMGGAGGFTKAGDGLATFGTGARTYTGATIINGGRMRISQIAAPTTSSSFTINSGGQLDMIAAGTFSLGAGALNLNGAGASSGPFAAFPGAIRNDSGLVVTVNNATVLQSDTLLHVEGNAGSLTFANAISGAGKLTLGSTSSSATQGQLVVNGANSYQGGTLVRAGTLVLSGASATLGLGNVAVDNTGSPSSVAKLSISAGVLDAINNSAILSLAGGGTAGVADQSYADLGAGINETVGGLILGGLTELSGTYGSSASAAQFKFDEYFSGTGILTVVPEPGVTALMLVGGAFIGWQRIRRRK